MTLFDDLERTEAGPGKYSQPHFDFLNRSARRVSGVVRNLLEEWFAQFPVNERADLRGRFRSPDDRQHLGAFVELYLHTVFRTLTLTLEAHPVLAGSARRPDFRVR